MNQFLSYISFKDKERPAEEIFMTAKLGAVLVRHRHSLCSALAGAECVSAQC